MEKRIFRRVGEVERWNKGKRSFDWRPAYSWIIDGKETQSRHTRREIQSWARRDNFRAVFEKALAFLLEVG